MHGQGGVAACRAGRPWNSRSYRTGTKAAVGRARAALHVCARSALQEMTMGHQSCRRCEAAEARLLQRRERHPWGDWRSIALVILMLASIALAALTG